MAPESGIAAYPDAAESGSVQSGPNCVAGSGALIIAKGPAWCSPLNGVNLVGSSAGNPQLAASFGLLNQNPKWKVLVGGRDASASKPKIWSSRIVLIRT